MISATAATCVRYYYFEFSSQTYDCDHRKDPLDFAPSKPTDRHCLDLVTAFPSNDEGLHQACTALVSAADLTKPYITNLQQVTSTNTLVAPPVLPHLTPRTRTPPTSRRPKLHLDPRQPVDSRAHWSTSWTRPHHSCNHPHNSLPPRLLASQAPAMEDGPHLKMRGSYCATATPSPDTHRPRGHRRL